jgi:hypothetical protein
VERLGQEILRNRIHLKKFYSEAEGLSCLSADRFDEMKVLRRVMGIRYIDDEGLNMIKLCRSLK